ncbi:alpha/beta fold hydrolase [Kribbella italica]|uniref:Pimeloyl-ACP methyl ester carboxylesterase n=1 Tax=Kribbella italica TaxID=1540520 RepID=A0A7W9J417_9ACTN|nr:alpha/beta fold hydrolase [Kribbella italica]MBB5835237.1 pimeloyl-ACP methyl ester carboxylesterase [Kribbella italica]
MFAHAVDGSRIAYQLQEGASGNGPALLLLAGQSNTHHWWDPVRADFARTTITLDYRGTGDSDKPDEIYSTPGFAEDAVAVLDQLGLDQVDVYGTSMGGRVAQWLAILHPERVRGLVLGCTSPGRSHGFERSQEIRRALSVRDQAQRDAVLIDLMYTPEWVAENPGPYPVLGDPAMPAYAKGRHLVASNNHDAWDGLDTIQAPTLILHGTDDIFSPAANAEVLADRIPNARAELLPGARHAYFHEFRTTASPLVTDFLAGL